MRTLFFILGILAINTASAQQRTEAELRDIAAERLGMTTRSAASTIRLQKQDSQIAVYGNDDAFVVMARDSRHRPVLGYSYTKYDESNMPCGMKWWMEQAAKALAKAPTDESTTPEKAEYSVVAPFVNTLWNQTRPYNYSCPKEKLSDKDRCPTGCVATTMAQAMKYFGYPSSTDRTNVTYTVGSTEKNETMNATTYNWSSMKNSYRISELQISSEVKAVSQIMYNAGRAAAMQYTAEGSGTNDYLMALALTQVFKYDSLALHRYDRMFFNDKEWSSIIYSTLERKQPVLLGGSTVDEEGHEFLLCGVDADGLVYVNWGWGGEGDGYFDMMTPRYYSYTFSEYQSAVVGMRAQQTPDGQDKYQSMWVSDSINYMTAPDPDLLLMQTTEMYNYSLLDFNGSLDLTLQDKNNPAIVKHLNIFSTRMDGIGTIGSLYGFYFVEEDEGDDGDAIYHVDTIAVEGLRNVPAGIYRMYLTSNEDRDTERQAVRVPGGVQYATLKKLKDGTVLVSNDDVADIDVTYIRGRHDNNTASGERTYTVGGRQVNTHHPSLITIENGRKYISR